MAPVGLWGSSTRAGQARASERDHGKGPAEGRERRDDVVWLGYPAGEAPRGNDTQARAWCFLAPNFNPPPPRLAFSPCFPPSVTQRDTKRKAPASSLLHFTTSPHTNNKVSFRVGRRCRRSRAVGLGGTGQGSLTSGSPTFPSLLLILPPPSPSPPPRGLPKHPFLDLHRWLAASAHTTSA